MYALLQKKGNPSRSIFLGDPWSRSEHQRDASCEKFIYISYDSDSEKLTWQQAYCDSKASLSFYPALLNFSPCLSNNMWIAKKCWICSICWTSVFPWGFLIMSPSIDVTVTTAWENVRRTAYYVHSCWQLLTQHSTLIVSSIFFSHLFSRVILNIKWSTAWVMDQNLKFWCRYFLPSLESAWFPKASIPANERERYCHMSKGWPLRQTKPRRANNFPKLKPVSGLVLQATCPDSKQLLTWQHTFPHLYTSIFQFTASPTPQKKTIFAMAAQLRTRFSIV